MDREGKGIGEGVSGALNTATRMQIVGQGKWKNDTIQNGVRDFARTVHGLGWMIRRFSRTIGLVELTKSGKTVGVKFLGAWPRS